MDYFGKKTNYDHIEDHRKTLPSGAFLSAFCALDVKSFLKIWGRYLQYINTLLIFQEHSVVKIIETPIWKGGRTT
jgi:hypothetical protein